MYISIHKKNMYHGVHIQKYVTQERVNLGLLHYMRYMTPKTVKLGLQCVCVFHDSIIYLLG